MAKKFRYLKIMFKIVLFLILVICWLWAGTAIYLAGPGPHWLHTLFTAVFALFLPAAFMFSRSFSKGIALCLAVFALVLVWWQTLTPTSDKEWAPDVAQISHGEIQGDTLVMKNVRNFDYESEQTFQQLWETREYDLKKLEGLDIFLSYWASDNIAHTILSWDFGADGHLAISIETRKDKTQQFSALKGFFKQFEIAYVAADEEDIIRLRTNYRKERVYIYRLLVEKEHVLALLKDYLKKMNSLVDNPEFYDALTHNCTTTIQLHANAINPGEHPPLDWRLIASGHVDKLLYDNGRISTALGFPELRRTSRVDLQMQEEGKDDFSRIMRQYVRNAQKRD